MNEGMNQHFIWTPTQHRSIFLQQVVPRINTGDLLIQTLVGALHPESKQQQNSGPQICLIPQIITPHPPPSMQQASVSFPNKNPSPAPRPEAWPLAPFGLRVGPRQAFVNALAAEYLMSSIWLNDRAVPAIYRQTQPTSPHHTVSSSDGQVFALLSPSWTASTASMHDHAFPISWLLNEPGSKEMINPHLLYSPQASNWETEENRAVWHLGPEDLVPRLWCPSLCRPDPAWPLALPPLASVSPLRWSGDGSLWPRGGQVSLGRRSRNLQANHCLVVTQGSSQGCWGVRRGVDGIVLSKQMGLIFRSLCVAVKHAFSVLSFSLQDHCCCLPHVTPSSRSTRPCTGVFFFSWSAK